MKEKTASWIAFIALMLAILGLIQYRLIFGRGAVAITVQVLAVLLMLWARLAFGFRSFHAGANPTAGSLITSGPYRFFRHPIYAAILYFVWAGALSHLSLTGCLLAGLATAGIAGRIVAEERLLVKRYPEYVDYAARTKRIIPFVL